jgi:uncharacterized protein (DUF1697 family)
MKTWIALFRGINVGGNNRLPMKDLVELLATLGCSDIKTYIQSGNVVFNKSIPDLPLFGRSISKAIFHRHGFEPIVQLLTIEELRVAAQSNPFVEAEAEPKTLHLSFLSAEPEAFDHGAFDGIKADSESYKLIGKRFYLHAPDGIGRSKLAARAEKLLGVQATGRNWRTVTKLLGLASNSG